MELPKDHLALSQASSVQQICAPLFTFGIKDFRYTEICEQGERVYFHTNVEYLQYYFDREIYKLSPTELLPTAYSRDINVLWDYHQFNPELAQEMQQIREYFNIDHGFTILRKQTDSVRIYTFSALKEQRTVNNFYLNNVDVFYNFIDSFQEQAQPLINKQKKENFQLPEVTLNIQKQRSLGRIYKNIHQENFKTSSLAKQLRLTQRELICCYHLVTGKTAKEIAYCLAISNRTVETHIHNIKNKLKVSNKSQLISWLIENYFALFGFANW